MKTADRNSALTFLCGSLILMTWLELSSVHAAPAVAGSGVTIGLGAGLLGRRMKLFSRFSGGDQAPRIPFVALAGLGVLLYGFLPRAVHLGLAGGIVGFLIVALLSVPSRDS